MKFLLFLPVYFTAACFCLPFVTTLFMPQSQTEEAASDATEPVAESQTIEVFNHLDNKTVTLGMEEYLIGVVSAEMPAAFEDEALKAQSVAARTYAMYKSSQTDHEGDVCTNFAHCQAYISPDEMQKNWGDDYNLYYNKIKNAVYSTKGEYLSYNSEPIMAVFHSMGGGQTQNSSDVWGSHVPYLVSVPSPGEEAASNYITTEIIPFDTFKEKILAKYPAVKLGSYLDVSQPVLNQSGHVKNIYIGTISISGEEMRSLFSLRSSKFELSFAENNVIFTVTGYGHGVGMSQYGANAMAKNGKTYKEILSHYYQGAVLSE